MAIDLRGCGLSRGPSGAENYCQKEYCNDVLDMMEHLRVESASFFGHDWGSCTAYAMCLHFPEKVERLVSLNTPFFPSSPIFSSPVDYEYAGQI